MSADLADVDARDGLVSARHDGHHQSQVSASEADIDERGSFREGPWRAEWPYLALTPPIWKVRGAVGVVSSAIIASGVNQDVAAEIRPEPQTSEAQVFW